MPVRSAIAEPRPNSAARTAERVAFVLLVACIVARPMLGEMPFRLSALRSSIQPAAATAPGEPGPKPDVTGLRIDLTRVVFATLLLTALAIWLVAKAMAGRFVVRFAALTIIIAAFSAWTLACALHASDKRTALMVWFEQSTLLSACWLTTQFCADRRRLATIVLVLVGLAGVLAIKGAWQIAVERSDSIAEYEKSPDKYLAHVGIQPGTPEAQMYLKRIYDASPKGFLPLTNVYGSVLLVLMGATAGLAGAKLVAARRSLATWRKTARKGEIHAPTLASVVLLATAPLIVTMIFLTGSIGAIVSLAAGAMLSAAVLIWRQRLARHRQCAILALAAMLTLTAAAVVSSGLRHDSLPTKTMTFRWYYWTAGAEMVRDNPLWGVGPGNFPDAYLRYRRARAEESVKLPHNVLVHAATQFGLPGGAMYMAFLVGVLILITRPAKQYATATSPVASDSKHDALAASGSERTGKYLVLLSLGCAAAAMAARGLATFAGIEPAMFFIDAVMPAGALAAMILLAGWSGGFPLEELADSFPVRLGLGCGLAAMTLHNMTEFGLWTPGTATIFWAAAGAALGAVQARERNIPAAARWALAGASMLAVAVAAVLLVAPVWSRTTMQQRAADSLEHRDFHAADSWATQAAQADPLDSLPAADAAQILSALASKAQSPDQAAAGMNKAIRLLADVCRRDPFNHTAWRDLADAQRDLATLTGTSPDEHLATLKKAVDLDGQNSRLRLEYARRLHAAGRANDCDEQLREALRIDDALYPESTLRFTPKELNEIAALRDAAATMPR